LPILLIIQLKRFNFNFEKNDNYISYPINNLKLKKYAYIYEDTNTTYKLIGINCHSGNIYCGHYYSYCRNIKNNKWYKHNDEIVTKVTSLEDLITNDAYLLFYHKIL